jgi:hypothetical protein
MKNSTALLAGIHLNKYNATKQNLSYSENRALPGFTASDKGYADSDFVLVGTRFGMVLREVTVWRVFNTLKPMDHYGSSGQ